MLRLLYNRVSKKSMEYLKALQDARVQYAIAIGKIDDSNVFEVVNFLESTMRKTAQKTVVPEYGYIVVQSIYAYFARKIEHGHEAEKTCDLDAVLHQIDRGELKRVGADKSRSAVYYSVEPESLAKMKKLLTETQRRLDAAIEEYQSRLNKHKDTFDMPESVAHLTRRVNTQQATIHYLERH